MLIINLLTCLTPLFLAYIIENVSGIFLNQDESKITVSLWLIIAFMIYQALFSYLNSRYKAKYRQKLRADLSKDICRSIFNQNHNEFYENSIGSYLSLFTNDVKMVDDNYFFPFLSMITQCVVYLFLFNTCKLDCLFYDGFDCYIYNSRSTSVCEDIKEII